MATKLKLTEKTKEQLGDLIFQFSKGAQRAPVTVRPASGKCGICNSVVPRGMENEFYCTDNCRKIAKAWYAK